MRYINNVIPMSEFINWSQYLNITQNNKERFSEQMYQLYNVGNGFQVYRDNLGNKRTAIII